jgi:hypothetical protein
MFGYTISILRISLKAVWYLLVVFPGYVLMLLHLGIARLSGHDTTRLPTTVYRLCGTAISMIGLVVFVLIIGLLSGPPNTQLP